MTNIHSLARRRAGFTLVELLTVVGIIALLIGILVPSLARARDLAKKTKTAAEISAIEKSLEVFENDFKSYPESDSRRYDPIVSNLPGAANGSNIQLMGAHWLARALSGPDTQGLDSGGLLLKDVKQVDVDAVGKPTAAANNDGSGVDYLANVQKADRKGSYVEDNKILAKDTDTRFGTSGAPATGRFVFIDTFNWPILYYKARTRAPESFCYRPISGSSNNPTPGVYDQADNEAITGSQNRDGWDFASTGFRHGLGFFGPNVSAYTNGTNGADLVESTLPPTSGSQIYKGKSFVNYLHEHRAHDAGKLIKPVKPEGFILLSPGKDGVFGTEDDVNNFDR